MWEVTWYHVLAVLGLIVLAVLANWFSVELYCRTVQYFTKPRGKMPWFYYKHPFWWIIGFVVAALVMVSIQLPNQPQMTLRNRLEWAAAAGLVGIVATWIIQSFPECLDEMD